MSDNEEFLRTENNNCRLNSSKLFSSIYSQSEYERSNESEHKIT